MEEFGNYNFLEALNSGSPDFNNLFFGMDKSLSDEIGFFENPDFDRRTNNENYYRFNDDISHSFENKIGLYNKENITRDFPKEEKLQFNEEMFPQNTIQNKESFPQISPFQNWSNSIDSEEFNKMQEFNIEVPQEKVQEEKANPVIMPPQIENRQIFTFQKPKIFAIEKVNKKMIQNGYVQRKRNPQQKRLGNALIAIKTKICEVFYLKLNHLLQENGFKGLKFFKISYSKFISNVNYSQNRLWLGWKMINILVRFGEKKNGSNMEVLNKLEERSSLILPELIQMLNKTFREIIIDYYNSPELPKNKEYELKDFQYLYEKGENGNKKPFLDIIENTKGNLLKKKIQFSLQIVLTLGIWGAFFKRMKSLS